MSNEHREISVSLPERLVAQVDILLYDPTTGRIEYGKRSELIRKLLERWVDEQNCPKPNSEGSS